VCAANAYEEETIIATAKSKVLVIVDPSLDQVLTPTVSNGKRFYDAAAYRRIGGDTTLKVVFRP
jgi:hypothetical protein